MTTTPVVQVAADGRWETAEVVPLRGDPARARSVVEHAARTAEDDVAVEVLWPAQAFVGVRWPASRWQEAAAATGRAYTLLGDGSSVPQTQAVQAALLALLGTEPSTVLEFAELGAVNAWKSTGPEVLWRRGDPLTPEALDAVLVRRDDLTTCSHPVAVEIAVARPRPCWVGITVSTRHGSVHHLDRQAVAQVFEAIGRTT